MVKLSENPDLEIECHGRGDPEELLDQVIQNCDLVFHLAGENRPKVEADFERTNVEFTRKICGIVSKSERSIPILFASSTQATRDNPYGISKKKAEEN